MNEQDNTFIKNLLIPCFVLGMIGNGEVQDVVNKI